MNENSVPQATRVIPVETLTQKIGTLIIQNDFLADEVNRISKLYLGLKGELAAEIGKIEADLKSGTCASASDALDRIKAKL